MAALRTWLVGALAVSVGCSGRAVPEAPIKLPVVADHQLRPISAFASIADSATRSRALFEEVTRVLLHPRCVNCHPADDTPRQGDRNVRHDPPVVRGSSDRGVVGMQCQSCHQDRNVELTRLPGARDWHLAPASMAWLGKTPEQLCEQLSDRSRNGNRSLNEVADHLAHDPLVGWGWAPGADRAPPPGSQAELAALFREWIASGAVCPASHGSAR